MWQPIGDSQFPLPVEYGVRCGIQTGTGEQHCVCARKWGWLNTGVTAGSGWGDVGFEVCKDTPHWVILGLGWVMGPDWGSLDLESMSPILVLSLDQGKCVWTRNQWGVRARGGKLLQSIAHGCGKDRCSPYGRADVYCCRTALWFGIWQPSSFWQGVKLSDNAGDLGKPLPGLAAVGVGDGGRLIVLCWPPLLIGCAGCRKGVRGVGWK